MNWLDLFSPITLIEKLTGWFSRPKPRVNFEYKLDPSNENDYCHLRRDRDTGKLCWFFRIEISNNGKVPIKNCDIRLEGIERKEENKFVKASNFSPVCLHWANDELDSSRDVHYNTPNYLDVVHTIENVNSFFIFAKRRHIGVGSKLIWPEGEYRLRLKILGANTPPQDKIIYINFNGQWDQLKMELLNGK